MKITVSPHPFCWVNTKWGRHKAKAIGECSMATKSGIIHKFVLVEFIGAHHTTESRQKLYKIKNIEYIGGEE